MWLRKLLGYDKLLDECKLLFARKEMETDVNSIKQELLDIVEIIKSNEKITSAALNDMNSKLEIIEEKLKKI